MMMMMMISMMMMMMMISMMIMIMMIMISMMMMMISMMEIDGDDDGLCQKIQHVLICSTIGISLDVGAFEDVAGLGQPDYS